MLINPEFTIGTFRKEIHGNELYLFNAKGELIFKRWLDKGYSMVFDVMSYNSKKSYQSITEEMGEIIFKINDKNIH